VSKQLAISASASIFAMVALTVFTTTGAGIAPAHGLNQAGATVATAAPSVDQIAPVAFHFAR